MKGEGTRGGFEIDRPVDPSPAIQELEARLYEHNSAAVGRRDGSLFAKVARDDAGAVIGGVGGWTWAGACEVAQLWVAEARRGQGLGAALLRAAEEEARAKGCTKVLVRSYDFQAPDFYEKLGYAVVNVIENFPPGHRYYTLLKELGPARRSV